MAARAAACATVPGADIRPQLATLLGKREVDIGPIRRTSETPPRISVIDVATLITGKNARNAARDVGFVKARYPEVAQKLSHFNFRGQGQRNTEVTCTQGLIELVLLLPGRMAGRVRSEAARIFTRYPGVDLWPLSLVALVPLILALRGQTTRRCVGLGWTAGMVISVFGFYWLREMLVIFSKTPEPLPTLLTVLMCAYQAGRLALCGLLFGRAVNRGWNAPLVFAGAFAVSELIYPLLFPWYFGASVHNALPLLQVGEIGGPILIGLVLVAPNLAVAHVIEWKLNRTDGALSKLTLAVGLLVPVLAAVYGVIRISQVEAQQQQSEAIKIALIQGNKPLGRQGRSHEVLRRLTRVARKQGVDLVIWSESVF